MAISKELLAIRQALPLDVKIQMSKRRIAEFVDMYGLDGVYISFSGGIDSTVLLHMARELYPDIWAAFADTWMEMPQVRAFVHGFKNVDRVKPFLSMKEVIDRCGWCFPSKEVAALIEGARIGAPWAIRKLNGVDRHGNRSDYRQQFIKWRKLVDAPFKISPGCCMELKEKPLAQYEEQTGRHPIVALMADESQRRRNAYLRTGCNSFDTRRMFDAETGRYEERAIQRPISKPMSFWTKNDVLQYVYCTGITIASPYGTIGKQGYVPGQTFLFGDEDVTCHGCQFYNTGEQRTGCMFCPVGCHLDGFKKFKRLKKYDPRLYDYCMEELGEKDVLHWIQRNIIHGSESIYV